MESCKRDKRVQVGHPLDGLGWKGRRVKGLNAGRGGEGGID